MQASVLLQTADHHPFRTGIPEQFHFPSEDPKLIVRIEKITEARPQKYSHRQVTARFHLLEQCQPRRYAAYDQTGAQLQAVRATLFRRQSGLHAVNTAFQCVLCHLFLCTFLIIRYLLLLHATSPSSRIPHVPDLPLFDSAFLLRSPYWYSLPITMTVTHIPEPRYIFLPRAAQDRPAHAPVPQARWSCTPCSPHPAVRNRSAAAPCAVYAD